MFPCRGANLMTKLVRLILLIAWVLTLLLPTLPLMAQAPFDLVIRGGRIVDGTGNPWFFADIAIRDGKIALIGQVPQSSAKQVDASGLIVAPGFIDMHSHSDTVL